jgi:hypothetical protein
MCGRELAVSVGGDDGRPAAGTSLARSCSTSEHGLSQSDAAVLQSRTRLPRANNRAPDALLGPAKLRGRGPKEELKAGRTRARGASRAELWGAARIYRASVTHKRTTEKERE